MGPELAQLLSSTPDRHDNRRWRGLQLGGFRCAAWAGVRVMAEAVRSSRRRAGAEQDGDLRGGAGRRAVGGPRRLAPGGGGRCSFSRKSASVMAHPRGFSRGGSSCVTTGPGRFGGGARRLVPSAWRWRASETRGIEGEKRRMAREGLREAEACGGLVDRVSQLIWAELFRFKRTSHLLGFVGCKFGIFRICENGISRSNAGNAETIGIGAKLFSTRFRI